MRPIRRFNSPSGGIRQELGRECRNKLRAALDENRLEALKIVESLPAGQFAGRVDLGLAIIRLPPVADRVEILEREAKRVDLAMAIVTSGDVAVLFQLLTNRLRAAHVRIE